MRKHYNCLNYLSHCCDETSDNSYLRKEDIFIQGSRELIEDMAAGIRRGKWSHGFNTQEAEWDE